MMLQKHKLYPLAGKLVVAIVAIALLLVIAGSGSLVANEDAWVGSYWNNQDLGGPPALVRYDSAIDFDWAGLSPDVVIQVDNFSARWERTVVFANGTYRFKATMDDGMRVWVDGILIIDDWNEGKVRTREADIALKQGAHKLRVEYFEKGGKAIAGFTWDQVDGNIQPLPPGPQPLPPGPQPPPPPPPSTGQVIYPVGEVKSSYLNMRQGPGTKFAVTAVLPQNTQLRIMARSSGGTWYLVQAQAGPTGWVKRYYVHTDFPYTSLPVADNQPMPTPKPPVQPPTYPSGTVLAGYLNVRSGPGVNYNAVAVVRNGTTVALVGRSAGGSWLKVRIPTGTVGWVNGGYIHTDHPIHTLPAG
ncbi:MAG: SH3 domain-containing protein [Candidatus Promineifilaceae bacterium]|nr:SH3 domain-containing protein [Candidatus Promineifilaceae bacterium]